MTTDAVGQQPILNTSISTAEPVSAADNLQLLCMYVIYVCMYVNMYADWRTLDASLEELLCNIRKNWQAVMKLEDERSRGVILKSHEVKGFLESGMAGLYEVKRSPCHVVEHLSAAALDLAMLNAQSQHNRSSADQIARRVDC